MTKPNVIEMHDITKKFGEFVANDHINLDVRPGEIHALLGENGAGKSTLMNMLAGLLQPTSGIIKVNGQEVTIDSPSKATKLGIGMVHQHFMLVEAFTVAENIILGSEVTKAGGVLDMKKAIKEITELSERYGLAVDPTAKVADISVGAQQRVEILKTLYRGAGELIAGGDLSGGNQQKAVIAREIDRDPELLIVSQPTRGLDVGAIEYIRKRIIAERDKGKAVIVVSFELDEILDMSDRIAVIYDGAIQGILDPAETNKQDLGILMAGGQLNKEEANV